MSDVILRKASQRDFESLRHLYSELTNGAAVLDGAAGQARLAEMLAHPGTSVFGSEVDGVLASVATLHICPNLTHGGRPYARIENVVTSSKYRGLGLSGMVMQAAIAEARSQDVISIILLTGKEHGARLFYEKLGFNAEEKWGMILRP